MAAQVLGWESGHRLPVYVSATAMRDRGGEILGAVEIFNCNIRNINVIEELQKLRKEILTDPLTGIGNRRYAEIRIEECERDLAEYGIPYGILVVDIDDFKSVNDKYGHDVGDKVLRMVGTALSKGLRGMDAVCRWGGEEFLVISRNLEGENLLRLGERLRVLVENSWIEEDGGRISVTASFGGATAKKGMNFSEVFRTADIQLYRSKTEGKNRVRVEH